MRGIPAYQLAHRQSVIVGQMLLASELGWTAFEERIPGFLDVVWRPPCKQQSERFMAQLLFKCRFHALLQRPPSRLHSYGWPGGDLLGEPYGFLQELVCRYETVQESNAIGFLGLYKATGVNQVAGATVSDQARQKKRQARVRTQAALNKHRFETCQL